MSLPVTKMVTSVPKIDWRCLIKNGIGIGNSPPMPRHRHREPLSRYQ
jgi:hypothetical protein